MNASVNAMPTQAMPPATFRATRPFYWSVRREMWEYRSIYLAPLGIGGVCLLGFLVHLAHLPSTFRTAMSLDPAHQRDMLASPFNVVAALIMFAAFIVSIFYSIDALYGERRERSILFWKSMPVSDLIAVLSKTSIPLVVLPVVAFVVTVVTEMIMLLLASAVLVANGLSVATLWNQLQLIPIMFQLLYHLATVHMLWYAPFYAWLLLVSAWSRRAPFLWVVLPPFAIHIFEKTAFHTSHFVTFLNERFSGGTEANTMGGSYPMNPGMHMTPLAFLATPGLWFGLMFSAACLFAAMRLRRYRGPI